MKTEVVLIGIGVLILVIGADFGIKVKFQKKVLQDKCWLSLRFFAK